MNKEIKWTYIPSDEEEELYEEGDNFEEFNEDEAPPNMYGVPGYGVMNNKQYKKLTQMMLGQPQIRPPQRQMWWGETNFNIGKNFWKSLCDIPGVETAKPISRYTFFMSVGNLFDSKEVKEAIDKLVY